MRDQKNPSLRILLSLGGGETDTESFHASTITTDARSKLIDSIMRMMENFDLDGLDIDWEFPGWSKYLVDRDNFVLLLQELRQRFDENNNHIDGRRKRYELSIAVSPSLTIIKVCYPDISVIGSYVDFINLMSYDYHDYSSYFPFVEYNAPLRHRSSESGLLSTMNTEWSANYWNESGIRKDKIMIGIPTYSHNYILSDGRRVKPGSPAEAETYEFTFSDVCTFLSKVSTAYVFDKEAGVPYAYNGRFWSSFDDIHSVTEKVNFIKQEGFGGSMTYDLNCDDFKYKCNSNKRFPIQSLIWDMLSQP
jgi:chitinase